MLNHNKIAYSKKTWVRCYPSHFAKWDRKPLGIPWQSVKGDACQGKLEDDFWTCITEIRKGADMIRKCALGICSDVKHTTFDRQWPADPENVDNDYVALPASVNEFFSAVYEILRQCLAISKQLSLENITFVFINLSITCESHRNCL